MSGATRSIEIDIDVFCRVVDNFGDAAVAWRVSRILANEHGFAVRLFIDHLPTLAKLVPTINPDAPPWRVDGVEVLAIDAVTDKTGEVVLEAFGCGLPPRVRDALAGSKKGWINLEYLSAEPWVEGCHALPSPQGEGFPERYFFFPGFTPRTGGILREAALEERRLAFTADRINRETFWSDQGAPARAENEVRLFMFAYPSGWGGDFLATLAARATAPLHLILAEGVMQAQVDAFCGASAAGASRTTGQLTVSVIPFLAQSEFDQVLWASDLAIVRGEDSFVRAQLGAIPMLWDVYPQAAGAHLKKLEAFLDRYCAGWPHHLVATHRALSLALLHRDDTFIDHLLRWCDDRQELTLLAGEWTKSLQSLPELGLSVGQFARKLLECRPS